MADSARPDTIDYLRKRGLGIIGAIKGKGSVEDGAKFLRAMASSFNHAAVARPTC